MDKRDFSQLVDDATIDLTVKALKENGIRVEVVDDIEAAKQKVLSYIPKGAEVFTSTSKTLEKTGIAEQLNESGDYVSIRHQLNDLRGKEGAEADKQRRQLGAAPEYILGSVQAVTEVGEVLVASGSGSQIPGYAYSAKRVIWVIGTQKIVKNMAEAMARLKNYVYPLEDQRMKQVHGPEATANIRKLLIINKEGNPDRIRLIFVKQAVGF